MAVPLNICRSRVYRTLCRRLSRRRCRQSVSASSVPYSIWKPLAVCVSRFEIITYKTGVAVRCVVFTLLNIQSEFVNSR